MRRQRRAARKAGASAVRTAPAVPAQMINRPAAGHAHTMDPRQHLNSRGVRRGEDLRAMPTPAAAEER
jgi:hypothetical protein